MSLPVPLTVRVGDRHITQQVQSLSFRREAIGGVRSIAFSLARPLSDLNGLDPLAKVYVYDSRTAQTVAQGRLSDTGRGADGNGERWDCVAFGPAQHTSDTKTPIVYVDRSLTDGWQHVDLVHQEASVNITTKPGDAAAAAPQGILLQMPSGLVVGGLSRVVYRYLRAWESGQKLARVGLNWDSGITNSAWLLEAVFRTDANPASGDSAISVEANTAGGSAGAAIVTNFANGRTTVELRFILKAGTPSGTVPDDLHWAWFDGIEIETVRVNRYGTEYLSGYNGFIPVWNIVDDLIGRFLSDFDPDDSVVDTSAAVNVRHMAYPDGATPEQLLNDCMALQPSFRWYTTPDRTGNGYGFRWEPWPTTVRYEATLDDGGTFPISTQGLFNRVAVRWKDPSGITRTEFRTLACPVLDNAGLTRTETIDLGSEAGTEAQAQAAGDAFLADHNVPKNSGTLAVARPIRDVLSGRTVQPWEIEAGELVRVLGVEAYPDAFNADDYDGQGVFRIHAVDYNSDGNTATLALDSDPRTTEDALVLLMKERSRR